MRFVKLVIISAFLSSCYNTEEVAIKTTSSEIAIGNLNSQIDSLEKLMNSKSSTIHKNKYTDLLLTKMQFFNNFDDLQKVKNLVDITSKNVEQIQVNMKYFVFIHDYNLASRELAKIDRKKYPRIYTEAERKISLGRGVAKLKDFSQKSFTNSIRLANKLANEGKFKLAEEKLLETLYNVESTSPFPVSYLYFNLGLLFGEKNQNLVKAKMYYKKAIELIPEYSSATVHLTEIYISEGQFEKSLKMLKALEKNRDPEVFSTLSEIYLELGKNELSLQYKNLAHNRYQELLKLYPYAFYDHASEFYMSIGNNKVLAQNFALKNLSNRKGQRAYALALSASAQLNTRKDLCRLVKEIPKETVTFVEFEDDYLNYKKTCEI